jgi:hypothetical protein
MIVITGNPRSRTSMMTRCIHLAGVSLAFEPRNSNEEMKKKFRNPYGFFEGQWNGKDGVIKSFASKKWSEFNNIRIIYMEREKEKIQASWKEIREKSGNKQFKKLSKERLEEMKKKAQEMMQKRGKQMKFEKPIPVKEAIKDYPHIIVNSDKFVLEPESYRKDFEKLFPELDFDLIKSGIDKELYIDRSTNHKVS